MILTSMNSDSVEIEEVPVTSISNNHITSVNHIFRNIEKSIIQYPRLISLICIEN